MTADQVRLMPGRAQFAGAPDGAEAWVLRELLRQTGASRVVFVARDAERRARVEDDLAVFLPEVRVIGLPAWDCLPYDRSSPNREIVSERMRGFRAMAALDDAGPIVIATTINALLQRTPPKTALTAAIDLSPGDRFDEAAFRAFVSVNGYVRADTVMEPGEFAFRGSIVDVFPAGSELPARIDLFGDEVEAMRSFDPLTQRSEGVLERLTLAPASEAPLDKAAIERFRTGYRTIFGGEALKDP
ncbi:MAG: transcription-repair coupling factor, partial [Alphaproteobacteria bacterium]